MGMVTFKEFSDVYESTIRSLLELGNRDEKHELLRLIKYTKNREIQDEFLERFGGGESVKKLSATARLIIFWENYRKAAEEELEKLSAT